MNKINVKDMFNLSATGLREYPKLALKLKSVLEKAKITKVLRDKRMEDNTYFDDLTLIVKPRFQRNENSYRMNYSNSGSADARLYAKLGRMKGWIGETYMHGYSGNERKEIKVNVGSAITRSNVEIGCYLPDRNALVLYYDIFNTERSDQLENQVLFFFVNNLIDYMKKNNIKKKNLKKIIEKKTLDQFSASVKDEISKKERAIRDYKESIESWQESIINYTKNIAINEVELESVEKMLGNVKDYVQKQVDDIKRLGFVKAVELSVEGLKVNVGDVFIKYSRKDIYIGDFTIIVNPKKVRIINNDPVDTGSGDAPLIHPHISTDGGICYGSRESDILKLLANNEFKKLIHMVYLYLKSYNGRDTHYPIQKWIDRQRDMKDRMKQKKLDDVSDLQEASYDEDEEGDDDYDD
jgi:hypothetical protein